MNQQENQYQQQQPQLSRPQRRVLMNDESLTSSCAAPVAVESSFYTAPLVQQHQISYLSHNQLRQTEPSSATSTTSTLLLPPPKKKRSLPGNPDPDAEVIALSPKSLLSTNRFICEICKKGFQRDQNLQLHRRGHNLPWKLKQRSESEVIRKKVYVCPEPSCVHHEPSRALGDLTGIKKHFCRKHGEKRWKCSNCSKCYAVQSDRKAHSKTCGTREYRCECGTLFSRKDSFVTHRAFCSVLSEETAIRMTTTTPTNQWLINMEFHVNQATNGLLGSSYASSSSSCFFPSSSSRILTVPVNINNSQLMNFQQYPIDQPHLVAAAVPGHERHLPMSMAHDQMIKTELPSNNNQSTHHDQRQTSTQMQSFNQFQRLLSSSSSPTAFSQELLQVSHGHRLLPQQAHENKNQTQILENPNYNPNRADDGPTSTTATTTMTMRSFPDIYGMDTSQSQSAAAAVVPQQPHMSATALLQRAAQMGATVSTSKSQQERDHVSTATDYDNNCIGLNWYSRDEQGDHDHQIHDDACGSTFFCHEEVEKDLSFFAGSSILLMLPKLIP